MRGVVFKNLGQKFSSIIHTADLDSDSLFALCAARSPPPRQWEFRQAGKAEFGAPAGRDTAGTRQGHGRDTGVRYTQGEHNITVEIPCAARRARCPSLKTHYTSLKHASSRNFKLVCLSSEQLVLPLAKEKSFN